MQPIKLRWLIAHTPAYLFVRTAEAFAAELEKELPGQFEIEILTMREYIEKYGDIPELKMRYGTVDGIEKLPNSDFFTPVELNDAKKKWTAFFNGIKDTKIHLSQTQVSIVGWHLYKKLSTLDLPFLFNSHDHVTEVLDGEIGDNLRKELFEKTNINGLAFTYSGGYRIVGSNQPIENLEELKDVNITTTPMTQTLFGKFAKKATSKMNQKLDETSEQVTKGGAIETTYLRFAGKNVLKTNHSMFLTTILVGGSFFNTLTKEQQEVFQKTAKIVAKLERKWSLEDAQKYEDEAVSKGITIKEITVEESQKLKDASPDQYTTAYTIIEGSKELVDKIKNKG